MSLSHRNVTYNSREALRYCIRCMSFVRCRIKVRKGQVSTIFLTSSWLDSRSYAVIVLASSRLHVLQYCIIPYACCIELRDRSSVCMTQIVSRGVHIKTVLNESFLSDNFVWLNKLPVKFAVCIIRVLVWLKNTMAITFYQRRAELVSSFEHHMYYVIVPWFLRSTRHPSR